MCRTIRNTKIMRPWEEVPSMVGMILAQDIPPSLYCCIRLHCTLTYTNQPKPLVTSRSYHVVITTNIRMNRMAR